jgi:type I restriction enzyme S subunit
MLGPVLLRRIGDVSTDVADGPHVTPEYVDQGIPFITAKNITSGRLDFRATKFITHDAHKEYQRRAKAEAGDVLVTKDGTIGMPCFIDTDRAFSFFVSVALIKPRRDCLRGEFLTWILRAPYLQDRIHARSRGDMIRHLVLVLREIKDLLVPMPSLGHQLELVAYLDSAQAEIGNVRRVQAESAAELDALLPSVLDRAFRGEL